MEVTTTSQTQPVTTAKPAAAQEPQPNGAMISSDFQTFLKMLTTQMENQDPLNPMDSTDFAVQLATFSGVEQQVKTNDLLDVMSAQLGAMNMSDLAGWVGMEARAVASAWFEDTPITLHPEPASGAQRTIIEVRDASGVPVDRVEVPVSDAPLQWAGVTTGGQTLPPGQYSFHLQSYSNDEQIGDEQIAVFSEVVEARVEEGETVLVLASGDEVPASDIAALREPPADG